MHMCMFMFLNEKKLAQSCFSDKLSEGNSLLNFGTVVMKRG